MNELEKKKYTRFRIAGRALGTIAFLVGLAIVASNCERWSKRLGATFGDSNGVRAVPKRRL